MKPPRLFSVLAIVLVSLFMGASARAEDPSPTPPGKQEQQQQPPEAKDKPAARREDVDPSTLTEAKDELKTVRGERDAARADVEAAEQLLTVATKERDDARTELAEAKTQLGTAQTEAKTSKDNLAKLTGFVKAALSLTDEQVANLASDDKIIPAAVEAVAGRKAVEIAADQGKVPPVRTVPAADGESDIKQAFADASKEPDPVKRGALFAAASDRLAQSASKAGNN